MRTHYDKLGVARHASAADIEQSYRHSLSAHLEGAHGRPLHKKDLLRLQQMRQAYLVLASPGKRLEYDLALDQREHARLRKIERIGTLFGLVLLVAGLALIAHGYYRQVYDDQPVQAVHASEVIRVPQGTTVLAAEARTASSAD